jgi:hypothetical protein
LAGDQDLSHKKTNLFERSHKLGEAVGVFDHCKSTA